MNFKKDLYVYPALLEFHKADDIYEEDYYTLFFPDFQYEDKNYPHIKEYSKNKAKICAKEYLAITIALILEDNEVLPPSTEYKEITLSKTQELIEVQVYLTEYKDQIDHQLKYRHFHPGYYKNNQCIEGIAIKNTDGLWKVYFDDFQDAGLFKQNVERDDDYGVIIFIAEKNKIDEEFEYWVETILLPFRNKK